MYTLMLQMPNFPCSDLFWLILPINRALSWDTTLGSQGPAIVAHAPVSRKPEWWEGGKLACWKKSPDEYENSDTTGSLKKKKNLSLLKCLETAHWDCSPQCLLWDGGCAASDFPGLGCDQAPAASEASPTAAVRPFPRPCLSWQSRYRTGLSS